MDDAGDDRTWRDVRPQVLGVPARTRAGEPLDTPAADDAEVLVEWYDLDERFARPLGGGVHFGEGTATAVRREFAEETGHEVRVTDRLGVVENVFRLAGERHHELTVVYAVRFRDPAVYERDSLTVTEGHGAERTASWHPLAALRERPEPLYPERLHRLLTGDSDHLLPVEGGDGA